MCPKDLEGTERFVHAGGRVLAFEPFSEFALPEIASPPTGQDTGIGRSPAQVIKGLADAVPGRVARAAIGGRWTEFLNSAVSRDIGLKLRGSHMIARRSVCGGVDFIVLANGSKHEGSAGADFGPGRNAQIWDPWTGSVSEAKSQTISVTVPGYSAMVVVSERNVE